METDTLNAGKTMNPETRDNLILVSGILLLTASLFLLCLFAYASIVFRQYDAFLK